MKLEYTGKEPMNFVGGIVKVTLNKGDVMDVPDAKAKKWLADATLGKLFKAVKEKDNKGKDKNEEAST